MPSRRSNAREISDMVTPENVGALILGYAQPHIITPGREIWKEYTAIRGTGELPYLTVCWPPQETLGEGSVEIRRDTVRLYHGYGTTQAQLVTKGFLRAYEVEKLQRRYNERISVPEFHAHFLRVFYMQLIVRHTDIPRFNLGFSFPENALTSTYPMIEYLGRGKKREQPQGRIVCVA